MDNLAITLIAAVILMALAIAALSAGLIITGKSRLKKGCGLSPTKGGKKTNQSCPLCGNKDDCDEKTKETSDDCSVRKTKN